MIKLKILLVVCIVVSCSNIEESDDLAKFNSCIGKKKAIAIDELVKFVDQFMETNFAVDQDNVHRAYYMFLKSTAENGLLNQDYILWIQHIV